MNEFYYTFSKNNINIKQYIYKSGSYHYNWHKELELLTVLNGEVEVCTGGVSKVLKADDVILINSNKSHATLARKPNSISMVLRIEPEFFENYYENFEYLYFDCCSNNETRYDKPFILIRAYLSEMILSYSEQTPDFKLLFESAYYALLHNIVLYYPPKEVQSTGFILGNNRSEAIEKMVRYIDKNYRNKITLDDLAEISQYNRSYISQLFKAHLGINFYDYLTRIRLREATLELGQADKNISEIAFSNGFSDIKAFNKIFKSNFEKTPSEYRMQLNDDNTSNDISFLKEFLPVNDEDVNKKLRQYIVDKNGHFENPRSIQSNYKNTTKSVQLISEMSIKLKEVADELMQTTDGLEKIMWLISE